MLLFPFIPISFVARAGHLPQKKVVTFKDYYEEIKPAGAESEEKAAGPAPPLRSANGIPFCWRRGGFEPMPSEDAPQEEVEKVSIGDEGVVLCFPWTLPLLDMVVSLPFTR